MQASAIYHQYHAYIQSDRSGWQLNNGSKNSLLAQAQEQDLCLEMSVNQFDSGILLSRMRGLGNGAFPTEIHHFHHNCAFFIMLSGKNHLKMGNREYIPSAGEIWLVRGELNDVSETILPINNHICALNLDFSVEKLHRWYDEGLIDNPLFSPQTANHPVHKRLMGNVAGLMASVRPLMQQPFHNDGLSQLFLESSVLELTARLLRFSFTRHDNQYRRKCIHEAIDILTNEFQQQITIAELSRRVGLNECYLKRYFKQHTGDTIASYLRRLRMKNALQMLENGHTIQQTMSFVGYRHAGHFGQAFKAHYGYWPIEIKKGLNK